MNYATLDESDLSTAFFELDNRRERMNAACGRCSE